MVHYMGLIKAIGGAIRGTMADQWKEYFYCDSMDADVLVTCQGHVWYEKQWKR